MGQLANEQVLTLITKIIEKIKEKKKKKKNSQSTSHGGGGKHRS